MATFADWVEGARIRTLPAAAAPVLVGTGAAYALEAGSVPRALLAAGLALALQIGVNYANDYSDGIRGTDGDERVGPFRLVGSGLAQPRAVKLAAFACFGVAAVAGLTLAILTTWWLLAVGAAAIAAAWLYTGGPRPYGYAGYGELFVFIFFGLVAVLGTTYVVAETVSPMSVYLAVGMGAIACAILVANNLRDRASDAISGKRTLAVVLGDQLTRVLYVSLMTAPFALVVPMSLQLPLSLLVVAAAVPAAMACLTVMRGALGPQLIKVLSATGVVQLGYAVLFALAVFWH